MTGRVSPPPGRPRLRRDEFVLLRDHLLEVAGLHFDDSSISRFERRLVDRVIELELESFGDYFRFLRFGVRGRDELAEVIDRLTVNETYFFRQDYQLRAFADELLPRIAAAARDRRSVTLWSAGCSTGEEVYTLGVLATQSGLFEGWDLRILGSDISRRALRIARAGVYRETSFRSAPAWFRDAWFERRPDGYHVDERLRRICRFGHANLLDEQSAATVGQADAVFCRNVLIYFDNDSRRRVIDNLYRRLRPGGYLLLGHSESLLNLSTKLELVHLAEDLVYRRPERSAGPRSDWPGAGEGGR